MIDPRVMNILLGWVRIRGGRLLSVCSQACSRLLPERVGIKSMSQ